MKTSLIGLIVSLLLLAGCGSESKLTISSKPIELDIAKTADPNAVQMLPITFKVITRDTVDSFITELSKTQGASAVFIAITPQDYENLSLNFADLRRYIEQQKSIIIYYRQLTSR